jgi:hypothetical protein
MNASSYATDCASHQPGVSVRQESGNPRPAKIRKDRVQMECCDTISKVFHYQRQLPAYLSLLTSAAQVVSVCSALKR